VLALLFSASGVTFADDDEPDIDMEPDIGDELDPGDALNNDAAVSAAAAAAEAEAARAAQAAEDAARVAQEEEARRQAAAGAQAPLVKTEVNKVQLVATEVGEKSPVFPDDCERIEDSPLPDDDIFFHFHQVE